MTNIDFNAIANNLQANGPGNETTWNEMLVDNNISIDSHLSFQYLATSDGNSTTISADDITHLTGSDNMLSDQEEVALVFSITNGTGTATTSQRTNQFRNALATYDTNGDNLLSQSELGDTLWATVATADSSGDGKLSFSEYSNSSSAASGHDIDYQEVTWLTNYEQALAQATAEGKEVLVFFGGNPRNSGLIDLNPSELSGNTRTGVNQLLSDRYVCCYIDVNARENQEMVRQYATGADGNIRYNSMGVADATTGIRDVVAYRRWDFYQYLNDETEKAGFAHKDYGGALAAITKKTLHFNNLLASKDTNQDGQLSEIELGTAVWNRVISSGRTQTTVGAIDTSNNGSISLEEYMNSIARWDSLEFQPPEVASSYADAVTRAQAENKEILVVFGRPNCNNCAVTPLVLENTTSGLNQLLQSDFIVYYANINSVDGSALWRASPWMNGNENDEDSDNTDNNPSISDGWALPCIDIVDPDTGVTRSRASGMPSASSLARRLGEYLKQTG